MHLTDLSIGRFDEVEDPGKLQIVFSEDQVGLVIVAQEIVTCLGAEIEAETLTACFIACTFEACIEWTKKNHQGIGLSVREDAFQCRIDGGKRSSLGSEGIA